MAEHIAYFEADEGVSRANFNRRIEQLNEIIDNAEAGKGAAGGVATLDANAKVTAAQASSTIVTVGASRSLMLSDAGRLLLGQSTAVTFTVPVNVFPVGTEIEICRWSTNAVTIAAGSGVTIVSAATARTIKNRYGCVCLKLITGNTWLLTGDLG